MNLLLILSGIAAACLITLWLANREQRSEPVRTKPVKPFPRWRHRRSLANRYTSSDTHVDTSHQTSVLNPMNPLIFIDSSEPPPKRDAWDPTVDHHSSHGSHSSHESHHDSHDSGGHYDSGGGYDSGGDSGGGGGCD